jgi:hemolysin III
VPPIAGFPSYTAAERVLDTVMQAFAILLAVSGVAWLFAAALPTRGIRELIGVTVYAVGLIGAFAVSAAYHSCYPSRAKELLRRADHAMIFVWS